MDYKISKPNRIRQSERKTHSVVRGALPPTGLHGESRKERDRRRARNLKSAMR